MKKILSLTVVALLVCGFAFGNQNRKPAATLPAFTDGTTVDTVAVSVYDSGGAIYQIKQPNGNICYALAMSNGAGVGSGITCVH